MTPYLGCNSDVNTNDGHPCIPVRWKWISRMCSKNVETSRTCYAWGRTWNGWYHSMRWRIAHSCNADGLETLLNVQCVLRKSARLLAGRLTNLNRRYFKLIKGRVELELFWFSRSSMNYPCPCSLRSASVASIDSLPLSHWSQTMGTISRLIKHLSPRGLNHVICLTEV